MITNGSTKQSRFRWWMVPLIIALAVPVVLFAVHAGHVANQELAPFESR